MMDKKLKIPICTDCEYYYAQSTDKILLMGDDRCTKKIISLSSSEEQNETKNGFPCTLSRVLPWKWLSLEEPPKV
jgi:hypothetical protein